MTRLRTRNKRAMGPRPHTARAREVVRGIERDAEPLFDWALQRGRWGDGPKTARPTTRGECVDGPRPCPWVSCRHHLYLDVKPTGHLRMNFPGVELEDMRETCSLDVADRGHSTLEVVGDLVNLTRERVRQVEEQARGKVELLAQELKDDDDE